MFNKMFNTFIFFYKYFTFSFKKKKSIDSCSHQCVNTHCYYIIIIINKYICFVSTFKTRGAYTVSYKYL